MTHKNDYAKKYFHLSKIGSYIIASVFLVVFICLCIIFALKTYTLSFWFLFLVAFFFICFMINYQILKRIVLVGIKFNNNIVLLQGMGYDEQNIFHINELIKIEIQDSKKNTLGTQVFYERVDLCFILKSGRTKRLWLTQISNAKYYEIKTFFENLIIT